MTPEEKANELVSEFQYYICSHNGLFDDDSTNGSAIACAIKCVKEIIVLDVWGSPHDAQEGLQYWNEVLSILKNRQ